MSAAAYIESQLRLIHQHPQNSPEWFAARLGKPSGSSAHRAMKHDLTWTSGIDEYAFSLAEDTYKTPSSLEADMQRGSWATDYGHQHEPLALAWIGDLLGVEVEEIPLVQYEKDFICSPDGAFLSKRSKHLQLPTGTPFVVEAKCLPNNHGKALQHWQRTGKVLPDKFPQLAWNCWVCNIKDVIMVHYHDYLPPFFIRHRFTDRAFDLVEAAANQIILKRDESTEVLETIYGKYL